VQPFEDRIENLMNFINEVFVTVYVQILFILTEFSASSEEGLTNDVRESLGWALLAVVLAVIIITGLKKRCSKIRAKVIETQLQMQRDIKPKDRIVRAKSRPKLLNTIKEEVREFDEENEFEKKYVNQFNISRRKKKQKRVKSRSFIEKGLI
jgi:hypothetical protein